MTRSLKFAAVSATALLAFAANDVKAADLGGNCCADLEERIAELEATTARKGNRKVSLTISGWVAEQVMYWDSGEESNVYVGGIGGSLASHVKFTGGAKIDADNSAGYVLHLRARSTDIFNVNEDNDSALGSTTSVYYSYWFLKNEKLGKVSVGQQSQASDNAAILPDQSGSLIAANWAMFDGSNFQMSKNGVGQNAGGQRLIWGDFSYCGFAGLGTAGDCTSFPTTNIRYDSPTFAGFSVSATWGEDDLWDVAARYAGEVGGFKLAAGISYAETTDENFRIDQRGAVVTFNKKDSNFFQVGAYAQHIATGLFVYGAYGNEENKSIVNFGGNVTPFNTDGEVFYVKAGIRQKWNALGDTILWGEYNQSNDMMGPGLVLAGATSTEFQQWGLGIQQQIDAAAMSVWLKYRHYDAEVKGGALAGDFDSFDAVVLGGIVNF